MMAAPAMIASVCFRRQARFSHFFISSPSLAFTILQPRHAAEFQLRRYSSPPFPMPHSRLFLQVEGRHDIFIADCADERRLRQMIFATPPSLPLPPR
jgi:hypothetical protein